MLTYSSPSIDSQSYFNKQQSSKTPVKEEGKQLAEQRVLLKKPKHKNEHSSFINLTDPVSNMLAPVIGNAMAV